MRVIVLLFVVLGAAVAVAVRMLPWWALLAVFAALMLAGVILVRWGLPRLLTLPFKAKGAVLRDAGVYVHSIEGPEASSTPQRSDDGGLAGDPDRRQHFLLEITITPRPPSGRFTLWEPGELRIVGHGARADDPEADEPNLDVRSLEVHEDGSFLPDGGMKYEGPQRLRLLVAVPEGQHHLRFRYYFEIFGNISLPG